MLLTHITHDMKGHMITCMAGSIIMYMTAWGMFQEECFGVLCSDVCLGQGP
jgi:hypothetical protein